MGTVQHCQVVHTQHLFYPCRLEPRTHFPFCVNWVLCCDSTTFAPAWCCSRRDAYLRKDDDTRYAYLNKGERQRGPERDERSNPLPVCGETGLVRYNLKDWIFASVTATSKECGNRPNHPSLHSFFDGIRQPLVSREDHQHELHPNNMPNSCWTLPTGREISIPSQTAILCGGQMRSIVLHRAWLLASGCSVVLWPFECCKLTFLFDSQP